MRSIVRTAIAGAAFAGLAACGATTYQNSLNDFVGGVGAERADGAGKVWKIEVGGNADLAFDSAEEMLFLKGAETALRQGYELYEVRNSYDRSIDGRYRTDYVNGVRVGTYRTQAAKPRFIEYIVLRDRGEEVLDPQGLYSARKVYLRYAPIHIGPNAPSPDALLAAAGRGSGAVSASAPIPRSRADAGAVAPGVRDPSPAAPVTRYSTEHMETSVPLGHRRATAAERSSCAAGAADEYAAMRCLFVDLSDRAGNTLASKRQETECVAANPELAARNPAVCRVARPGPN